MLGRIHSHPGLHEARGPRVGHPFQEGLLEGKHSDLAIFLVS